MNRDPKHCCHGHGANIDSEQIFKDALVDAAIQKIREQAFREGMTEGARIIVYDMNECFNAACRVEKVIFNDMKTIVKFADGGHEIVTYNPAYGYPYDAEKGIMAAMLKHLMDNDYIKVLQQFGDSTPEAQKAAINVSKNMIRKTQDDYEVEPEPEYDTSDDGSAINLSDDEKMLKAYRSMDTEIDLY